MNELFIIIILVSCGAVSLVSYIIFIEMRKNQRLQKVNKRETEIIREEKESDRTDALKRGLHLLNIEKRKSV